MRAPIEWDVRVQRVKFRREEISDEAAIIDLSLEGALIKAPLSSEHGEGAEVRVRLGQAEGGAIIRHVRHSDDLQHWLYGVRWRHTPALRSAVESGVEQLRENSAELRQAWEDKRR